VQEILQPIWKQEGKKTRDALLPVSRAYSIDI